jgi:hypothetical protein
LFDQHRLALSCWARCALPAPAVLITFDRHFDLVAPTAPPPRGLPVEQLDHHVRTRLDEKNVDHILAAMELGLISHVVSIARAWPVGAVKEPTWRSSDGVEHQLISAPTLERLLDDRRALALLDGAPTLLDFDLDCFVTPSDADPFTLVPWPRALISDFVRPRGSAPFWDTVLARCQALTFAREPNHCGGVIAANRLFEEASHVVFEELLETDLP